MTLKVTDESPLFLQYHNDIWDAELSLLKEAEGKSCDERFPCGLYDLKAPKVFGEKQVDLEIQHVEIIGENHLTLFAWLTDSENCAKIALEVLNP
jgi:hypothetical protein